MSVQPTGVEIIDHVLGGIAPGLPCVLAGPSGAGRTVLSLQLAWAALQRGSVVSFLCNEPAPFLLRQAESLGFDFSTAVETGQFVLLEFDPAAPALMRARGGDALVRAIRDAEPLSSLLIVDPFTILTADILDEAQLRDAARRFVRAASPMSMVLTLESERLELQHGLERVLAEVCGAYLTLHRDEHGRRRLVVEKTRAGVGQADRVGFRIGVGGSEPVEEESESAEAPVAGAAAKTSVDEDETRRKTILVVDDDRMILDLMTKWLEDRYDVVTARDGFEAMSTLLTQRPDLVILDLIMPRVTGYELLPAFQRTASEIPLLVISGRVSRPGDRVGPLILGATDFLAKPVERFEVLRKVETLLRLSGPAPRLMDPAEAEALFATVTKSRVLEPEDFGVRLNRACTFGERYGLPSSMIALSASSSTSLDGFIDIAEQELRFEDAMLRVSKRRALMLLVAAESADAIPVVERLSRRFGEAGGNSDRLSWRVIRAEPAESHDWHRLFRTDGSSDEGTS